MPAGTPEGPPDGVAPPARPPVPVGWLALTLIALLAALLAGDLVYRRAIVPRLAEAGAVSRWWWLGVVGPATAVMLLAGTRLRAWRHVAAFAWAASALSVGVEYVRVTTAVSGAGTAHPAASAPVFFWVVGLLVRWGAFGVVLAVGAAAGTLARRRGGADRLAR